MFLSKPNREQAVALSGVFQACYLVQELAQKGSVTSEAMETCIKALLNQDPESVYQLYGSPDSLHAGTTALRQILEKERSPELQQILHYVLAILHLEQRLEKTPNMLEQIASGIEKANRQAEHFSPTHENVYSNLAGLYQETLSTFSFRIQVQGNPDFLRQQSVADKIRCLLFSAVRSAFLWRQLGGKRHHLVLFNRRLASLLPE